MISMDILAFIIGVIASILSIVSIRMSKANNETGVMQIYFDQYRKFHETVTEYSERKLNEKEPISDKENVYWRQKYKYAYEEYYNVLEYMCAKYINGEISEKTFYRVMGEEVIRICSDDLSLKAMEDYSGLTFRDIEKKWDCLLEAYNKVLRHREHLARMEEIRKEKEM